jgi:hypothetical protein
MAEPSKKSPEIEAFLEATSGRTTAIKSDRCVRKPIGCEGPATEFRDELSKREYTISGLCQKCQDRLFGIDPEAA